MFDCVLGGLKHVGTNKTDTRGTSWHVVARRGAHVGSRGAAERSRGSCQSGAKHVDSRHSAEPWRGSNHPFGKYLAILQVSAIKYP